MSDQTDLTPVLEKEEYVEQAYFFRTLRERIEHNLSAQEILAQLRHELLSTTKMPQVTDYLYSELKHSGKLSDGFSHLEHYFTPFQGHVIACSEDEESKLTFSQALLILEREAEYRAGEPSHAGLFIYELETMSRNQLGYAYGLSCMVDDDFFTEQWADYIEWVRMNLDTRDLCDLIFARSQYFVQLRKRSDADYAPEVPILFEEKEGMIAWANRGKDPMYLFSTLQRQLGYPEVPRMKNEDPKETLIDQLQQQIEQLTNRINLLEAQTYTDFDFSKLTVKPPKNDG